MAQRIASLYAEIGAETGDLKRGLTDAKKHLKGTAAEMGGLGRMSGVLNKDLLTLAGRAAGAGVAFTALGKGISYSIAQASDAQLAQTQLQQVLKSTGAAAGISANEILLMSSQLQKLTGVSDDQITKTSALLLTFTRVGRDVFPDATKAALNLSAAFGNDLQSSVIMLGKALNDPINGLDALRRVGISFTQQQEQQIKTMQRNGDMMGAQRVILAELDTQVGGMAEAMGDTYAGEVKKLQMAFADLGEEIGIGLLPPLTEAVKQLRWIAENTLPRKSYFAMQEQEIRKTAGSYDDYVGKVIEAARESNILHEAQLAGLKQHQAELGNTVEAYGQLIMISRLSFEAMQAGIAASGSFMDVAGGSEGARQMAGGIARDIEREFSFLKTAVSVHLGEMASEFAQTQGEMQARMGQLRSSIAELAAQPFLSEEQKVQLYSMREELHGLGYQYQANADMHAEATKRILFDMLTQRAAIDGLTEAEFALLNDVAKAWGLVDEKTHKAAVAIDRYMTELANGGSLDAVRAKILDIGNAALSVEGDYYINFVITQTEVGPSRGKPGLVAPPGASDVATGANRGGNYIPEFRGGGGYRSSMSPSRAEYSAPVKSMRDRLLDTASALSSLGSLALSQMEDKVSPIRRELEKLDQLLTPGHADMLVRSQLLDLEERRADAAERMAAAEKDAAEFQKQQNKLSFLQTQVRLLDTIKENSLDAADILGGLKLGLNADMGEVLRAMTRAMSELIGRAEAELGISSPSKEFMRIGREINAGLLKGINDTNGLNSLFGGEVRIAAPDQGGTGTVINDIDVNLDTGSIKSLLDIESMAYRVAEVIARRLR